MIWNKNQFNRYVTAVFRKMPWPIKRRILNQRPAFSNSNTDNVVVVLCHPRQYLEGFWSLWSWMRFLNEYAKMVLLIDGQINTKNQKLFFKTFS